MKLVLDSGVEIPIENIKAMELKPSDVITLTHPGALSQFGKLNIKKLFDRIAPLKQVIVLEEGLEITKIERPNEI